LDDDGEPEDPVVDEGDEPDPSESEAE